MDEVEDSPNFDLFVQRTNRCADWVKSIRKESNSYTDSEVDEPSLSSVPLPQAVPELTKDLESAKDLDRRRMRKRFNVENETLELKCEWEGCGFKVEDSNELYSNHVKEHIRHLIIVKLPDNSEAYKCLWMSCNFLSSKVDEIKRHVNYHAYHTILKGTGATLQRKWDIPACKLGGEYRNFIPELNPFLCEWEECNYHTTDIQQLLMHVKNHLEYLTFIETEPISCKWLACDMDFNTKHRMMLHLRHHTKEKSLACPTCGTTFANNTKFMDHCIRKLPIKDNSNRCQFCLRYFANIRLLKEHLRYHINDLRCSLCEMTCSTTGALIRHIRYRHLKPRFYKCTICSFKSVNADDCSSHMTTHTVEPRFQCKVDECGFACRSFVTFKRHVKRDHLLLEKTMYSCHLCGKTYSNGSGLGLHLRKKHKLERLPGHTRFRYMENLDGIHRLQVERFDAVEMDNSDTALSYDPEEIENLVLMPETDNNGELPTKFVLKPQNPCSFIAIDELDESGNLIRSSTQRADLLDDSDLMLDINDENCLDELMSEVIKNDEMMESDDLDSIYDLLKNDWQGMSSVCNDFTDGDNVDNSAE